MSAQLPSTSIPPIHIWESRVFGCGIGNRGQNGNSKFLNQWTPALIPSLSLPNTSILKIACGTTHAVALTSNGHLFSWGSGENYQLGHGDTKDYSTPTKIVSLEHLRMIDVACGESHTLAVDEFGNIWSFGTGREGQLGITGKKTKAETPTKLPTTHFLGKKVVRVESNSCFSFALTEDGKCFSFGWGSHGRLGHGDEFQRTTPCLIEALSNEKIVEVSCGWRHTIVINDKGEAFAMGRNAYGQLGLGDFNLRTTPTKIEKLKPHFIIKAACGERFSLVLTSTGLVFSFGNGELGNLGIDNFGVSDFFEPVLVETLSLECGKIKDISAGAQHSVAVSDSSGFCYSFGSSTHGQLGHNAGELAVMYPYIIRFPKPKVRINNVCCGKEFTMFVEEMPPLVSIRSSSIVEDMRALFFKIRDCEISVHSTPVLLEIRSSRKTTKLKIHGHLLFSRCKKLGNLNHLLFTKREPISILEHQGICLNTQIDEEQNVMKIIAQQTNTFPLHSNDFEQIIFCILEFIYCGETIVNKKYLSIMQGIANEMEFLSLQNLISAVISKSKHICLDWDLETKNKSKLFDAKQLREDLMYLFQIYDQDCDMELKVPIPETPEYFEKSIKAHSFILSARSYHFQSMLESSMQESRTGVIYLDECEVSLESLQKLVQYLYTDEVHFELDKPTQNFELLKLADQFGIDRLKELCEHTISLYVVDSITAMQVAEAAQHINAVKLVQFCDYIIQMNLLQKQQQSQENVENSSSSVATPSTPTSPSKATSIEEIESMEEKEEAEEQVQQVKLVEGNTSKILLHALGGRRGGKRHLLARKMDLFIQKQRLTILKRRKFIHDYSLAAIRHTKRFFINLCLIILGLPFAFIVLLVGFSHRLEERILYGNTAQEAEDASILSNSSTAGNVNGSKRRQ